MGPVSHITSHESNYKERWAAFQLHDTNTQHQPGTEGELQEPASTAYDGRVDYKEEVATLVLSI